MGRDTSSPPTPPSPMQAFDPDDVLLKLTQAEKIDLLAGMCTNLLSHFDIENMELNIPRNRLLAHQVCPPTRRTIYSSLRRSQWSTRHALFQWFSSCMLSLRDSSRCNVELAFTRRGRPLNGRGSYRERSSCVAGPNSEYAARPTGRQRL